MRKSISAGRGSLVSGQTVHEHFGISITDWFEEVWKTSLRYDVSAADPAWDWRMNNIISWGPSLSTFMPGLNIIVRIYITTQHFLHTNYFPHQSHRTVMLNGAVFLVLTQSEWINVLLPYLKIIYSISLPSAVPFLPAERSCHYQHNTLRQSLPNKNWLPKPAFPLRTRTTLSLTRDTRKKSSFALNAAVSLQTQPVLCSFSQNIPFWPYCQIVLSELLSSIILT